MDREALIKTLPDDSAFERKAPPERKTIAENFIGSILSAIAQEGRQPDAWEAHDIAAAIGFVMGGMYIAAVVCAERALTPPEKRAPWEELPAAWQKIAADPPTIRKLTDALDFARGMPAKRL